MSTETKRREILQMLANGSITAAEAGELLLQIEADVAVEESHPSTEPSSAAPEPPKTPAVSGTRARWLNVLVTDTDRGRKRVSVKIPLSLARLGLRMGAKYAPEVDEVDWDEILSQISEGGDQMIIEVNDEEEGERVQIFVS